MKYLIIFSSFFLFFSCVNTDKLSNNTNYDTGNINLNTGDTNLNTSDFIDDTNSGSVIILKNNIDDDIEKIRNLVNDGKIDDAEQSALSLYLDNTENIPLLNMLGNIYNIKKEPLKAIDYLEKANKLSNSKDGYILFNLGVSYYKINPEKSKKYLNDAKVILPNDENLDNFISNLN